MTAYKISDAIGGICRPWQIKRIAAAEAEASIIKAEGQTEVEEIQRRAMARLVAEEGWKQENMEKIIQKAIPQLTESSNPQNMENDWIANFFDKCRIVSNDEMQSLWSRILAGEANAPGTYSKRTVQFLSTLDKREAELFTSVCGFAWVIQNDITPLIFEVHEQIYTERSITFQELGHLDSIGLVKFNGSIGYQLRKLPKKIEALYSGNPLHIEFSKETDNYLKIGSVLLTEMGRELYPICGSNPVEGFRDYVIKRWLHQESLILSSPYPRAN